jgi:hypothetical protein
MAQVNVGTQQQVLPQVCRMLITPIFAPKCLGSAAISSKVCALAVNSRFVEQRALISSLAKAEQHPPHLAVAYFQPLGPGYLRQMLLLYLAQHLQAVPFSLAQSDSLRLHGALGHP